SIFKKSGKAEGAPIMGVDFNQAIDLKGLLKGFGSTGAQASELAKAIDIVKRMRADKVRIFLGYTSNMVTTGNRELIRYLVEHRLVDVLVTTAGGVEEDFIKTFGPFVLGDFGADGAKLRESGINRAGNIFIPNDRYIAFEKFFQPVLQHFMERQKREGGTATPSEIIDHMGSIINSKDSIYHWAHKNKTPVFCPAFMDGAIGDNVYFFNFNLKDKLKIDMAADNHRLIEFAMGADETGIIILGGGVVKHTICNANMFREGAKYAVYVNTAQEYDASDSGAMPDEARSWGKIAAKANTVKVFCDATIAFPLIVAGAFVD
ncbi:MAG: deoxyhypusine synthase, partial [Candidatus Aenigmarchaeota archaeon]|nr:deoxyhypusine synthase [Candidatus Aenigmarchaeota archaeon]